MSVVSLVVRGMPEPARNVCTSSWTTSPYLRNNYSEKSLHYIGAMSYCARAINYAGVPPLQNYFVQLGLAHFRKVEVTGVPLVIDGHAAVELGLDSVSSVKDVLLESVNQAQSGQMNKNCFHRAGVKNSYADTFCEDACLPMY